MSGLGGSSFFKILHWFCMSEVFQLFFLISQRIRIIPQSNANYVFQDEQAGNGGNNERLETLKPCVDVRLSCPSSFRS